MGSPFAGELYCVRETLWLASFLTYQPHVNVPSWALVMIHPGINKIYIICGVHEQLVDKNEEEETLLGNPTITKCRKEENRVTANDT